MWWRRCMEHRLVVLFLLALVILFYWADCDTTKGMLMFSGIIVGLSAIAVFYLHHRGSSSG